MKVGEDSLFHVNLTDANGKPIADARVTVTFVMPAMPAMNMPEMKKFLRFAVAGRQPNVHGQRPGAHAGPWNVIVEARKNDGVIASFHTHLNAK